MKSLEHEYMLRCEVQSDIHEHLPTIRNLAAECSHITEFGTRYGNSLCAFMAARPKHIVCYDIAHTDEAAELAALAKEGTTVDLIKADTSKIISIEKTDLLFIDSLHRSTQLNKELQFANQVSKYIVLHDTVTYLWHGEGNNGQGAGLAFALLPFLLNGEWCTKVHYQRNNGLTILQRKNP